MLETQSLVDSLREQPLHEAPQVGGVVEMEGEPGGVGTGEEGEEERDRVWLAPRASQAV